LVQKVLGESVQASFKSIWEVELMSEDVLGYSSHDWRKNTDDAIVIDSKNMNYAKVNDCKVSFKNPRTLQKEEVDLSRLIRVFVNNFESHKRSVK
jgi:hypothetical protein|tara:strand:- start:1096 stop:1380 length:285 start_codon:yes stop_codon:yes gene_type:complete